MTFKRWVGPVVLTAFALVGCAEQGADEAETMQSDTMEAMDAETGAMETVPDAASTDIATWNTDADARLTADEFGGWLAEQDFFAAWNTDGAEGLTPEELGTGLARVLDANDDGTISRVEWTDHGGGWVGGDADFAEWDADGDGSVDPAEAGTRLETSPQWSQWDRDGDGVLNRAEFDAAVFAAWDTNNDGYVDETEWRGNFDLWL